MYLTSGGTHSDERILEVEKDVRYFCPSVCFVNEYGNVGEIKEDWPAGNVEMKFLGGHRTVLRRSITFVGQREPILFSVCNCCCENGKAGLDLERLLEQVISYGTDQPSVKMPDFLAFMNTICFRDGPPIDLSDMEFGEEGLSRLSCVHTRAVAKIMSEGVREIEKRDPMILERTADKLHSDKVFGEGANVLRAMGVDTGSDDDGEDAAAGALLSLRNSDEMLLKLKVPRLVPLGARTYHAVVQHFGASDPWKRPVADPLYRFGATVKVSGRRKKTCLSHESQTCSCVYVGHYDLKAEDRADVEEGNNNMDLNGGEFHGFDEPLPNNDDDGTQSMQHREDGVVAKAYKDRPLLLPSYMEGYPNPFETDKYRERKAPDVCVPEVACDCVTGSDKKCSCLLQCAVCGSDWGEELTDPFPFHIYHEQFIWKTHVQGRRCSNSNCREILPFDGREDMVTPLAYHPLKGIYTGISTYFLMDLTASMARSHAPLSEYFKVMVEKYEACGEEKTDIPSIPTLFRDVQNVIRIVVVPSFPSTAYSCYNCGDRPTTLVMDGTSNGIAKRLAPSAKYFNRYPRTLPSPTFQKPHDLVSTRSLPMFPCYLQKISVPWKVLSNFSGGGDATALQELILRYSGAAPATADTFTADDMDAIEDLLNDNRRRQPTDVISWKLTQAFQYYFANAKANGHLLKPEVPSIVPVLQCIVAKSVVPVTGAPGQLVVACLLYLAFGFSCQTRTAIVFDNTTKPRAVVDRRRKAVYEQSSISAGTNSCSE